MIPIHTSIFFSSSNLSLYLFLQANHWATLNRKNCNSIFGFMAASKRLLQRLAIDNFKFSDLCLRREICSRAYLVNTLALVKKLKEQGVPSKQAETIADMLDESLENAAKSFIWKGELQKSEALQETKFSSLKLELQTKQDHQFSLLQRDIKELRNEMRNDFDILNVKLDATTTIINAKLDKVSDAMRVQLEATTNDMIKYFIGGTVISVSAVSLVALHFLK